MATKISALPQIVIPNLSDTAFFEIVDALGASVKIPVNYMRGQLNIGQGIYNVKDPAYGAKGDGVTDDTAAIQAAINAAAVSGGLVLIPGPCVTTGVTVRADNVWIVGVHGLGKLLLNVSDTTTPAIDIGLASPGTGVTYRQGCGVKDLEITHLTGAGHGVGIKLHDCMTTTLDNVYCHDLYNGLLTSDYIHTLSLVGRSRFSSNANYGAGIVGNATTRKVFFTRSVGARFEDNGSHGLYYYCGSDLYVTGQTLAGNNGVRSGTIIGSADGIHVEGTTTIPCESISLHNGDADSNMGYNIYWLNVHLGEISGYWAGGAGGQGRDRTTVPTASILVKAGVYFDTVQDASITGVRAANNSVHGIQLVNCYGVTVGPSTCQENGTWNNTANKNGAGVRVEGATASFVVLSGVNCASAPTWDGNQDYGFWIAAGAASDVVVTGCIAYNNAVKDFQNDKGAGVYCINCDFGSATNFRNVRGTGSAFEFYQSADGLHQMLWSTAAPGGTWGAGDEVKNTALAVGHPIRWVNTAAGGATFVPEIMPGASSDRGDASVTIVAGTDAVTQYFNTPLTTNRTVTLSTTGAWNGAKFRIVRTAAATGASTLTVLTKALTAGQWIDVEYTGAAWIEAAFGSL